jgi:radical SAM protein with 4Fe4S-binding SPASM domain
MVVYAWDNKFFQDNLPHIEEENDKICMHKRKQMETMPFEPWLKYVCTHCTKIFHCKSQCAESSHNHHANIASDPNNELS